METGRYVYDALSYDILADLSRAISQQVGEASLTVWEHVRLPDQTIMQARIVTPLQSQHRSLHASQNQQQLAIPALRTHHIWPLEKP